MKRFFTADTHFGCDRALLLSKRPFESVQQMDQVIIDNWNSVVGSDDIVYHLGDFGNYTKSYELNGLIKLLYGNYEQRTPPTQSFGFETIWTNLNQIITINGEEVALIHKPSNNVKNMYNLFGHIHKLQMVKRIGLNVGTDCHNFTPLSEEDVEFYLYAIKNHYDSEVFE